MPIESERKVLIENLRQLPGHLRAALRGLTPAQLTTHLGRRGSNPQKSGQVDCHRLQVKIRLLAYHRDRLSTGGWDCEFGLPFDTKSGVPPN